MSAKKKILFIDDEVDLLDIVQMYFDSNETFDLITASNSLETLELIKKHKFSAIIFDEFMKGESGLDLAKNILDINKENSLHIPFFLCSGNGRKLTEDLERIGFVHCFGKPFQVDEITATIKKFLV